MAVTEVRATHIVGGEIYYDNLGGNNYRITLKVYRDCLNGQAPFDGLSNPSNPSQGVVAPVFSVFDNAGNYITQYTFPTPTVTSVPPSINNPCIQTPHNICVEEAIYITTINLPPLTGGYYIVYQRCCRNGSILNLTAPLTLGATYWEHIPGPEVVANNSSPRFKKFPPIFICNGIPIAFDHSATDPDGDQLVYSLCAPYVGLDQCCPAVGNSGGGSCPACPNNTPPPYTNVPFVSPYSGGYPLSSNPAININSASGFLNGTPNLNGQWVVGVCVQEFRGGHLIGTHYRDFQFNVVTCSVTALSVIQSQTQFCDGLKVNFGNQSIGATTFHWDFGVPTITSDTSDLVSTNYTYPDTGRYTVTLIANPGKPCADTSTQTFFVYPTFAPTFTAPPPQCITSNNFSFSVGGNYASYTTFNWNFTSAATPSTSTAQHPTGIVYTTPGTYFVKVALKEAMCRDTLTDTVVVYQKPKANFSSNSSSACDKASVTITNTSHNDTPASYLWEFSDGTVSSDKDPTHVFAQPGVYSVTLTITTTVGCVDTSRFVAANAFTINPNPKAGFSFTPDSTTIFDPEITFFDQSQNAASWWYEFGDWSHSSDASPEHVYQTYGNFNVTQYVSNTFGCTDSVTHTVVILPEFRFWIPNSFTPGNKDGLNDEFMPVTIGCEEFEFYIFDRWGEMIFKTRDTSQGWNGTYKGKPCQQDIYVWMIRFKNAVTLRHEEHYGHVTLLK